MNTSETMQLSNQLILPHLLDSVSTSKFSLPLNLYSHLLSTIDSSKYLEVLDVGSFKGAFIDALNRRKNEFPDVKVHCFDAFQKNIKYLENNIQYANLALNHSAVVEGEHPEVTFSIPRNSYTDEGNTWGGRAVTKERACSLSNIEDQITVPAVNLSNYIANTRMNVPGLVKIDIQGGELDAIKGAKNYLKEIPLVYMECQLNSHNDIHFIEFMQNAGFEVFFDEYQIGTHLDGKEMLTDILNHLNIAVTQYLDHGCIYCHSNGPLEKLMSFLKKDGNRVFTYFQTDLVCINKNIIKNWRWYFLK